MRTRTIRAGLAAAVLAAATGLFTHSAIGTAHADTTVTTLPPDDYSFFPAAVDKLADLVVDGVHRRLVASDPQNGVISFARYDGSFPGATITDLPGVAGLALSGDSNTLYAALPEQHALVAFSTTSYAETARYPLGDTVFPRDVVVSGGRLWFAYDNGGTSGNFGSVDPADRTVALHAYTGISPFYGAPLMAADAGRLAVSDNSRTSGNNVCLYDVSTGVEQKIAERPAVGLSYLNDLAVVPGSGAVLVAGSGGSRLLSGTDLSQIGTYPGTGGFAVDASPDGRVAVADRTQIGVPDLYAYPEGATEAAQAFDMPHSELVNHPDPDEIMVNGVVWQPDGPRLFVVTENNGLIGFRALNEPVTPVISLSAPATAARAAALTITGSITAVPAGTSLAVTRKDLTSPNGIALAPVTTDAAGAFTVKDMPPAGGTVTYTVAYGDIASATASVAVSRTTPTLTLNRNGSVNAYGTTVSLTAHLGATEKNRTVEIWADPYGGDQVNRLLKRSVMDSSGNVTTSFRLTRNTSVTAVFAGDSRYAPLTVKSALYTRVSVSTAVTKQYKTLNGYYYFRKTTNPLFTTTMTASPGRKQKLLLEYYSGGSWHAWRSYLLPLDSTGRSTYTLTGTHATGVKYRARAAYVPTASGDILNYTTYGTYRYFTFTA